VQIALSTKVSYEQACRLDAEAKRTGKSKVAIISEALDMYFASAQAGQEAQEVGKDTRKK